MQDFATIHSMSDRIPEKMSENDRYNAGIDARKNVRIYIYMPSILPNGMSETMSETMLE